MKYLSIAFCLILAVLFNYCNNPHRVIYSNVIIDDKVFILRKTFDIKGNLVVEEILNKDSINNGYYKKWNFGKLEYSGTYIEGKKEGKWFYMDLGGDTIKIENWFSGKKFGNQYDFFSPIEANGKPHIFKFTFFSLDEKILSNMQFDVGQNVVKYKGSPLYCAYNKSSLRKDSTFELMCFWGCPPGMKFKLSVVETDTDGHLIKQKVVTNNDKDFEILDFANRINFEKKYLASGRYSWKIYLALFDNSNNLIIQDSSVIGLRVE